MGRVRSNGLQMPAAIAFYKRGSAGVVLFYSRCIIVYQPCIYRISTVYLPCLNCEHTVVAGVSMVCMRHTYRIDAVCIQCGYGIFRLFGVFCIFFIAGAMNGCFC